MKKMDRKIVGIVLLLALFFNAAHALIIHTEEQCIHETVAEFVQEFDHGNDCGDLCDVHHFFIDELRAKYPDVRLETLLKDAASLRLRPVLMTAFTTLFGILPLLWATGVGSEIQYPLAVVVTGGIVSSTLLTLLVLPALYLLFYGKRVS